MFSESLLSLESLLLLTEQAGDARLPTAAATKVAVETARAKARPAALPASVRQRQQQLRPHRDTEGGGKQMPHASVHCSPLPLLLMAVIRKWPHLVSICVQRWQRDDLG